ncbi:unnamed protein product [Oikopleura dioica]|uniref:PH domain-containing protein n=2 Tax=Oikopleura dioica TaxID=34765 RepID=E4WZ95_OIKDI|nr:unnamed protein product [Oikopleura dioica]
MKTLKKRKSRQMNDDEFREAFGFKQNPIARAQIPLVIPSRRVIPAKSIADSSSWASKDELGSRDELSSQSLDEPSGMSEDPSRGSADRLNFNSVETCSSGVGSDYSERTQSQDELAVPDIPLEAQLQINRRASRYCPIRVNIGASSHLRQEHAGFIHHRVGRRKWTQIWAVAVERLLYLYSSVTSDVTIDVVNLNDYSLEGDLIQPSQHKFRLKITHPQTETHEFYATNADSFYLWFATFDRLTSKRKVPKTIVQEKIQLNQLSMRDARKSIKPFDILGDMKKLDLSPRSVEKEKIQEDHRRLEIETAMDIQSKLTRLTQRRHSISQKIQSLNRSGGLDPTRSRRFRLQNDLASVNKTIEETVLNSKSSMSQIAASRERELSRKRLMRTPGDSSIDESSELDEQQIIIPTAMMTSCSRPHSATPQSRRSSLPKTFRKIRSFARSLSRSTSINKEKPSKSTSSFKTASSTRTDSYKSIDCGLTTPQLEKQKSNTSVLSDKEKTKQKNMSKLDPDTLEEIRKFEELAAEFDSSPKSNEMQLPSPVEPLNLSSTDESESSDPPFRENLI